MDEQTINDRLTALEARVLALESAAAPSVSGGAPIGGQGAGVDPGPSGNPVSSVET